MRKEKFDLLGEEALFWLAKTDAPKTPNDFHGPYKKKIYLEFQKETPEFVFVRAKGRSLRDLILAKMGGQGRTQRPN